MCDAQSARRVMHNPRNERCSPQVLVRELAAEEASWTVYDADEEDVKKTLASYLLDSMLSETINLFSLIISKKCQQQRVRQQCITAHSESLWS